MCKKLWITALALIAGVLFLNRTPAGRDLKAQARAWMQKHYASADHKPKPEDRLKQLKVEVTKIDDDLRLTADRLARQEVEMRKTVKRLDEMKKDQGATTVRIAAMVEALETKVGLVAFDGVDWKRDELAKRLKVVTAAHNEQKGTIERTEALLAAQRETRDAIEKSIVSMKEEKAKLEKTVASFETRLEQLRLAQRETNIDNKGSLHIDRCVKLAEALDDDLAEAETRIEVYKKHGLVKDRGAKVVALEDDVNVDAILKESKKAIGK